MTTEQVKNEILRILDSASSTNLEKVFELEIVRQRYEKNPESQPETAEVLLNYFSWLTNELIEEKEKMTLPVFLSNFKRYLEVAKCIAIYIAPELSQAKDMAHILTNKNLDSYGRSHTPEEKQIVVNKLKKAYYESEAVVNPLERNFNIPTDLKTENNEIINISLAELYQTENKLLYIPQSTFYGITLNPNRIFRTFIDLKLENNKKAKEKTGQSYTPIDSTIRARIKKAAKSDRTVEMFNYAFPPNDLDAEHKAIFAITQVLLHELWHIWSWEEHPQKKLAAILIEDAIEPKSFGQGSTDKPGHISQEPEVANRNTIGANYPETDKILESMKKMHALSKEELIQKISQCQN